MEIKQFGNKFIVRIDKGEEIAESLKSVCQKNNIVLGTISGIGATNDVTVGLFDTETKKYHSRRMQGNFEIASLSGNVSTMNGETYLHLHIAVGNEKHEAFGGHLNLAVVSATFEGVIEKIGGEVGRKLDEDVGLNLISF